MTPGQAEVAEATDLHGFFKLKTSLSYNNLYLFDGIGDLHKYAYARTSIEMDGTLNFDWSHLGGRILA